MLRRLPVRLLLLVAAAGFLLTETGVVSLGGGSDASPGGELRGRVSRVVDGDTIHVQVAGRREKVRYIGVDTPETVRPGTPVECFGKAASRANARLVDGRRVELRLDVEPRDRYGRLLAYVTRLPDGLDVNAELLRRGFAQPLTVPPNVRHAERFARLGREARQAGRGLWAAC